MSKNFKNKLKGTLIVPLGLAIVFTLYSLVIENNLFTVVLFWIVITPGVTIYLPTLVSRNKNHFFESVCGMAIFYALVIFMIYDHYMTDYFQLMIWTLIVNLILVTFITWIKIPASKTQ